MITADQLDVVDALHPALRAASDAAVAAYHQARHKYSAERLAQIAMVGADGTDTMFIDVLVEQAVLAAVDGLGVNVLSEERGWVDAGASVTLVIDPVDGSANAAAGVPLSCFSAALWRDGEFTEALTTWLHTGEMFAATSDRSAARTTGCRSIAAGAISLLRPHPRNRSAWLRIADSAARIRVLGCSTLDAALVATGRIDAFVDADSDTHRLMDIAAAVVLVGAAGGTVIDVHDRPIELDRDLTRRWSGIAAASADLATELQTVITLNDG